jgi:hypothetical protein
MVDQTPEATEQAADAVQRKIKARILNSLQQVNGIGCVYLFLVYFFLFWFSEALSRLKCFSNVVAHL